MSKGKYTVILIPVFIAVCTLCVYWQATDHGFINLDDPYYVISNRQVNSGLSLKGVVWAFTFSKAGDQSYWHPLTWLSHMLDCTVFGLDAGKHHIMNVLHHTANAVLLFLCLMLMTREVWKSAFAAAVFALHPVNVESVAWIAERKNLLSTMFWLLTLIAYAWYARKPDVRKYLVLTAMFIMGLLCKPMLVTIPFVLLLMDYWPLNRFRLREGEKGLFRSLLHRANLRLVYEKLPLLLVSLVSMILTSLSLAAAKQNLTSQAVPMALKIENAVTSYVKYIGKLAWPKDLVIFYMFPPSIPAWKFIVSLCLLAVITYLAILAYRRIPALIVGWLWFLGTLFPVIGIVQGGIWPEMAERWVYVPSIGLFIAVTWGVTGLVRSHEKRYGLALACVAAVVLAALSARTWIQLGYWQDDYTLYTRCLKTDPKNYFAHYGLGIFYQDQKNYSMALDHYHQALGVTPANPAVLFCIGNTHALLGNMEEAAVSYEKSLGIYPWNPDLLVNYGNALVQLGRLDEAVGRYREALQMVPYHVEAHNNLGFAYWKKGELKNAQACFENALKISPGYPDAARNHREVSSTLSKIELAARKIERIIESGSGTGELHVKLARLKRQAGDMQGAVGSYRQALALEPGDDGIVYELVLAHVEGGDYIQAIGLLRRMQEARPGNPEIPYNIACLYARQGDSDEAVRWLQQALDKGLDDLDLISRDPDLEGIRHTEFYRNLIGRAQAPSSSPGGQ